jgi:hypothetical protein
MNVTGLTRKDDPIVMEVLDYRTKMTYWKMPAAESKAAMAWGYCPKMKSAVQDDAGRARSNWWVPPWLTPLTPQVQARAEVGFCGHGPL